MPSPKPGASVESTTQSSMQFSMLAVGAGSGTVQLLGLNSEVPYQCAVQSNSPTNPWSVPNSMLPNVTNSSTQMPQTYKCLVTGVGNSNYLQLVGLGTDGQPYLPCYLDGVWKPGQTLPNLASNPQYQSLVTGMGHDEQQQPSLQVVGLGEDMLPYRVCSQDVKGMWSAGEPLPNVSIDGVAVTYQMLIAASGHDGHLEVLGLDTNGLPYRPCWQNSKGQYEKGNPLPNLTTSSGMQQTYKSLVTGVGNSNQLQVLGLDADGLPHLPCYQDNSSGDFKHAKYLLPNVMNSSTKMPQTYESLVTGVGHSNYLLVVGLGKDDGQPYLSCYQNNKGKWFPGQVLPNVASAPAYTALFTAQGANQTLLVLGLGMDGNAYLACWQDNTGNWYPGIPLNTTLHWVGVSPNRFIPETTNAAIGDVVVFSLTGGRSGNTTITPSMTMDPFSSTSPFTVPAGGYAYQIVTGSGCFSALASSSRGNDPADTINGSINVSTMQTPEDC